MIKIENAQVMGWEPAIFGMRNPKNSWEDSDTDFDCLVDGVPDKGIGEKDLHLMQTLADAGTDHGKFLRMIVVYADVTAPLYWWKEYDTYKVGTVANSCSTMHKIHAKEFTLDDFSHENLDKESTYLLARIVDYLEVMRNGYNDSVKEGDADWAKHYWKQMIQLLPSSYNQRRTVMLNYQVLKNMYHARKGHKLDEWREFCKWIELLPYSQLITGGKK